MRRVYECSDCKKKPLTRDEVGINKKLLGEGVKKFMCLDCLAQYLEVPTEDLLIKIEEFKEAGCKLFG